MPNNGAITYNPLGSPTGLYTVATYMCDGGFTLFGNAIRSCQSDGTWTGDEPSCEGQYLVYRTLLF